MPEGDAEHTLERQTWVSEIEIFELTDDGELEADHSEARGPVKNEDTIECTCGRTFDADDGRALAAEHLRSAGGAADAE